MRGLPANTNRELEVPLKRILQGARPEDVVNACAGHRPDLIAYYADLANGY
jgi:acetoacetyl-CoA synthetase